MGQTDGQTDGRTLDRFMTLTAYYSLWGLGNQRACVYVSRNNAQIAVEFGLRLPLPIVHGYLRA